MKEKRNPKISIESGNSNEAMDSIDAQIAEITKEIEAEKHPIKKLAFVKKRLELENSRGRLDYDADFFRTDIGEFAMNDFDSNDYWTCDACGGDQETGCMMSDPQNCSRN